jgi:hypothetical protein
MTKDEIIETKAAWGKTFVEIIDPTKENHVFRAYFEQPQREWVGLTDEEIIALWRAVETSDFYDCVVPLSRAIEAKLKEKNGL